MEVACALWGMPMVPLGCLLPKGTGIKDMDVWRLLWHDVYAIPENVEGSFFGSPGSLTSQSVIVEALIRQAFSEFGEDRHMFSMGYRVAGKGNFETRIAGGNLEAKFPNWVVSYMKSRTWQNLLTEIGDACMRKILWDIPILAVRKAGTFVQLSGKPVYFSALNEDARLKIPDAVIFEEAIRPIPATKTGKSRDNANHGWWRLRSNHPIESILMRSHSPQVSGKLLALFISRMNINDSPVSFEKTFETLIEPSQLCLRKPWTRITRPLRELMINYSRCSLKSWYGRAKKEYETSLVNTEVLLGSLKRDDIPIPVISIFLKKVLIRIIPRCMWGSRSQKRAILERIEHWLIRSRSTDAILWEALLDRLDPDEFTWLSTLSNRRSKLLALKQWLFFLFHYLASELLRACFIVIRDEQGGVVYYSHKAWQQLRKSELKSEIDRFHIVPKDDYRSVDAALTKRRYGMALARFVQKKKGGFRLILNLSSHSARFPLSGNQVLRPAFYALSCEVDREPGLGGAFVQGVEAIHQKWRTFVLNRRTEIQPGADLGLFAVAVDVKKCFDTMKHGLLRKCVERALHESEYATSVRTTTFVDTSQRTLRTKRIRRTRPAFKDTLSSLATLTRDISDSDQCCVLTDNVVRQAVTRSRVLELIDELIGGTYIALGAKRMRMAEGVPQGSILSTLLCRLYYGAFERETFPNLLDRQEDLLLRMVDDYLLVTPDKTKADDFVVSMCAGYPEWGCIVNAEKTRRGDSFSKSSRWISWCGLMLNLAKGWVRIRYDAEDSYSGAFAAKRGIGKTMRAALSVKCRDIVLDLDLNSFFNVMVNVAQMFALCAVRFCKYIEFLQSLKDFILDDRQIIFELDDFVNFAHALIRARGKHLSKDLCTLNDVKCLMWLAFTKALQGYCIDVKGVESEVRERYENSVRRRREKFRGLWLDWNDIERQIINVLRVLS